MNILFLDPVRLTNKDGCGIHRIELIKSFCYLNNKVNIFVKGKADSDFEFVLNLTGIKVYNIGSYRLKSLILYIHYLLVLAFKNNMDILYSRNVLYSIPGVILAKLKRAKMIFEKNGIMSDEASSFNPSNIDDQKKISKYINVYVVLESMELYLLRYCDHVITVTPLLKEYLIQNRINDKKIHVIENGANTDLFKPLNKSIARKNLNLSDEKSYVCFVGNLAPWQGIKYLIQAIPLVVKEKSIYFLIVGYGPLYEELKKIANELEVDKYVFFAGRVPYENVPLYINSSDVCVAPFIQARNERIGLSPLKIYEYMSCNKPIICSRLPNLEFIEEQNAGILFEPENVDKLASSIVSFFEEKYKYENLSAREYILENNSWIGIAKRILSVVNE